MSEQLLGYVEKLKAENEAWVADFKNAFGEVSIFVPRESIIDVCRFLKTQHGFDLLADICGADRGAEEDPRFEVNYHLFSTTNYNRLRLKVVLSEDAPNVPSVCAVWRTANWHERETFDMFGVIFDGHPNLERILLPSDFDGHALRKDYPLRGYEPYNLT